MFKIEGTTIHCSRGEKATINLSLPFTDLDGRIKYEDSNQNVYWYNAKTKKLYDSNYEETTTELSTLTMILYQFKVGDEIKFNIYEKNGYDKQPIKTKIVTVSEETDNVNILLDEDGTTLGELINKPTIYWYDISLNEYLTVVCYDEDGAKEFIEYPAKGGEE